MNRVTELGQPEDEFYLEVIGRRGNKFFRELSGVEIVIRWNKLKINVSLFFPFPRATAVSMEPNGNAIRRPAGELRLIERGSFIYDFGARAGSAASNRAHIPYLPSVFARHTVSADIV